MRKIIWVLFLLVSSLAAAADDKDKAELQGLYAAMNALNQEQQALFQQFQMLQELRRANDRVLYASQLRPPLYTAEIPNYNDVVQAQREIVRRGYELAQQTDQLYAQYDAIGARKALLQQRILELTLPW